MIHTVRACFLSLPLLIACAERAPEAPPVRTASARETAGALRSDLDKFRARAVPECASHDDRAEVWGKNDAAPGLPPEQVKTFVCLHRREVESACWRPKFSEWERSEIEYGLVVDPSGSVLGAMDGDSKGAATASLERRGARVSSPELARCVETVVDSWKFPRATMPTWMTLSFRFPR